MSEPQPCGDTDVPNGALLELRGITCGYGRTTVLRDVSFTIGKAQVVALLGPNGAGKTSTLRVLAGLIRPQSGTIWLDGADITESAPHQRSKKGLCLIPEGRGVFRPLTVRENLRIQVPPWVADRAVEEALTAFPMLKKRLGQTAGTMSGGEQQMLALARAYLAKPSVVMLDEVSMGLAPRIVDQIFESLQALVATGLSLLLVEQFINRALKMADHVVLLNSGVVSFNGPASALDEARIMQSYLSGESLADAQV